MGGKPIVLLALFLGAWCFLCPAGDAGEHDRFAGIELSARTANAEASPTHEELVCFNKSIGYLRDYYFRCLPWSVSTTHPVANPVHFKALESLLRKNGKCYIFNSVPINSRFSHQDWPRLACLFPSENELESAVADYAETARSFGCGAFATRGGAESVSTLVRVMTGCYRESRSFQAELESYLRDLTNGITPLHPANTICNFTRRQKYLKDREMLVLNASPERPVSSETGVIVYFPRRIRFSPDPSQKTTATSYFCQKGMGGLIDWLRPQLKAGPQSPCRIIWELHLRGHAGWKVKIPLEPEQEGITERGTRQARGTTFVSMNDPKSRAFGYEPLNFVFACGPGAKEDLQVVLTMKVDEPVPHRKEGWEPREQGKAKLQMLVKLPRKLPDPDRDPKPNPPPIPQPPPPKPAPPKPAPGDDSSPDSACRCYGQWVETIWRQNALAACRHSLGDSCLGYEVRWQKRYQYSPEKGSCVGSYQGWKHYLHPPQDPKPTWFNDYSRGVNRPVGLALARERCRELRGREAPRENRPGRGKKEIEPDRTGQEKEITTEELLK